MADTASMWRSKCNNKYLKSDIEKWDKQMKSELADLRRLPHNRQCFDCDVDDTTWASPKLGIFICVACSDVHRAAGAHITCVKNFNTYLWGPDEVEVMKAVGNKIGKRVYGNALVLPSESKDRKVAKCVKKYGGAQTQQVIANQIALATATNCSEDRRDESSESALASTKRANQTGQHSQDSNDDWFDNMLWSNPISSTQPLAPASPAKDSSTVEASLQLLEAKRPTDWFDLLGTVELAAEEVSMNPKVRAEKGRPLATVLAADDELELFFNSLE